MVTPQLVKATPVRQLLGIALLSVSLAGCGGGSDVDFSKPPPGLGGGGTKKEMSWGVDPEPGGTKTATPATATTPAMPDAAATGTETAKATGNGAEPGGAEPPATPDATKTATKPPKKKVGVVRISKAANADDAGRFDDDDEDNIFANWRTKPFKFRPIDLPYLRDRRKASFSENGTLLAGTNSDDEIVVFRTKFGEVQCLLKREDERPTAVTISEVTNLALVDYGDSGVQLYDIKDLRRLDQYARDDFYKQQSSYPLVTISEEELSISRFVQAGKKLLTATQSGLVEVRDVESYAKDRKADWPAELKIQAHETPVLAACFSKDYKQLVTASRDGAVKVWNTQTSELITKMEPVTVPAVCLCPISKGYAIGRANGVLELWTQLDAEQQKLQEILERNQMMITTLTIEPKRKLLVKSLISGAVVLQDPRSGELLSSQRPHRLGVATTTSSPDKLRILTCGVDGQYGSWPAKLLKDSTKTLINDPDEIRAPLLRFRVGKISARDDDDGYSNTQIALIEAMRSRPQPGPADTARTLAAAAALRKSAEADRATARADMPATQPFTVKDGPARVQSIKTEFDVTGTTGVKVAVSPSGETVSLAVSPPRGQQSGQLYVWDVPSGSQMRNWTTDRSFKSVQLVGDGHWLIPFVKPARTARKEEESPTRFNVQTGDSEFGLTNPGSIVEHGNKALVGLEGRYGQTTDFAHLLDTKNLKQMASIAGFESLMPTAYFMPDGRIVASVRERLLSKLVILSGETLEIEEELFSDKVSQPWIQENGNQNNILGITDIAMSEDGSTMVTHGQYSHSDFRFVIWKRKGGRFDQEDAKGVKDTRSFLADTGGTRARMQFIGRNTIAALTPKGLVKISADSGKPQSAVEVRTDESVFDPKGKWLFTHDGTGSIEVRSLTGKAPSRKDQADVIKFRAQDAPIMAMACSQNGRFLVTVGQENKLNVFDLEGWKPRAPKRK